VITVKSGLDPDMIIELEDGLKIMLSSYVSHMLMAYLTFMLNVGWYKFIIY
jgi:hypothetical protein